MLNVQFGRGTKRRLQNSCEEVFLELASRTCKMWRYYKKNREIGCDNANYME